ncbi:RNA methyltransferase [Desulfosporosinus sp. PR]|uniref:RNA methyltransferase n=1 Tax=Candidatus Desulfosporosinus nitrosoreducens TaxID=3401928 RepID=UPI0027F66891|nr:RNA methyltransferase [Desulfosporosinus sp. PR]MDQ7094705.1 RNA methyltransferase [Desulfosporosinus sp. PR]
MADIYLALIHAPVYNKNMETVATSITNLDLHDIARSSTTYGIKRYYVVHPAEAQRQLAKRIMRFWQEGYGAEYNPDRQEAFSRVRIAENLAEVYSEIQAEQGRTPLRVATDARKYPNTVSYAQLRQDIETSDTPILLLFGTGWGLLKEDMETMDQILEPIYGPTEYNHLSVRSAVAIILDRLRGH